MHRPLAEKDDQQLGGSKPTHMILGYDGNLSRDELVAGSCGFLKTPVNDKELTLGPYAPRMFGQVCRAGARTASSCRSCGPRGRISRQAQGDGPYLAHGGAQPRRRQETKACEGGGVAHAGGVAKLRRRHRGHALACIKGGGEVGRGQ